MKILVVLLLEGKWICGHRHVLCMPDVKSVDGEESTVCGVHLLWFCGVSELQRLRIKGSAAITVSVKG